MRVILFLGLLCTVFVYAAKKELSACYQAKTCIHNAQEKCGKDKDGDLRRFLDSCDMMEFNCLKSKSYTKVAITKCDSLPPLEDKKH